ncbi:unnamed protein product [Brassicogethes aeneus]|uniref:Molybdopterin synthase catalytic subunit n=1 Tax=Brassicogethes aeneus TaxID=1431903 RepID=A0A9P0FFH8_BRAAE|nr:unnamed protein product [Brassicogethes aeneus]
MNVEIKVVLFAKAREIAGKHIDNLTISSSINYQELLNIIVKTYGLQDIKNNLILALNEDYCEVNSNLILITGDEIAVIPPLSAFSNEKLSVEKISDLVAANSCGAISIFVGTTRDNFEGKKVLTLEYEAYESMGLKSMNKICEEIRDRWSSVENIAIHHRLGLVPVKDASIIIAISSPHRQDAIKATEWCINSVKESVPIWKKEVYADSKPEWKENKESDETQNKKPKLEIKQKVHIPTVPNHLIQIKASNDDINSRISTFMNRKRQEINDNNIKEFCVGDRNDENSCARIDAVVHKRKDSKTHLEVQRVLNAYSHRDQTNSDYLKHYIPKNGIEERLQNLECQLSLETPTPKNIYKRIKMLEDRLMHLESISPEYIMFWDKNTITRKKGKKKVFSIEEIDDLINSAQMKSLPKIVQSTKSIVKNQKMGNRSSLLLRQEEIAQIQQETGFTASQIERLYSRFTALDRGDCGTLSRDDFLRIPELAINPLGERIVNSFFQGDEFTDRVNFRQFMQVLSHFRPIKKHKDNRLNSREEKLKFAFKMYDLDNDDLISKDELLAILHMMVGTNISEEQLISIAERTILEADEDGDQMISFEEFCKALSRTDVEQKMSIRFLN